MAKRLRHSILILVLLQAGQNLSSLLLLPVLTRNLGPEGYGEVAFCIAFIGYFVLLADWGFGLWASQQIAICREDRQKRSEIFWTVFITKCFFAIIGALLLSLLIFFVPGISDRSTLLWLVYLTVVATAIAPAFYYQGIEALEGMFFIGLLVRFASIPLIYLFVKNPSDIELAVGIQVGAQLLAALINFYRLIRSGVIEWVPPTKERTQAAIQQSWPLFLSTASGGIFSSSLIVILGWVSDLATVGYFVGALNLIRAGQGLLGPISQVVFPRLSHLFAHAKDAAIVALEKIFIFQSILTGFMTVGLFLFAPFILPLLMGPAFLESVSIFRILTPLFFLGGISNLLGQQILVTLGYHRAYTVIGFIFGIIGLSLIAYLGYYYQASGAAASLVVSEILVIVVMAYYVRRVEPQLLRIFRSDKR